MEIKHCTIAIDFDGTIVTHDFPRIGMLAPYAKQTINELAAAGHQLFLWTMRDNKAGRHYLDEAMMFLEDEGINITAANVSPHQFSISPKQYAEIYIDDSALGCPKITMPDGKRVVSWSTIALMMASAGLISKEAYKRITGEDI